MMFSIAGCGANSTVPTSAKSTAASADSEAQAETGEPIELILWGGIPQEMGPDTVVENYNKLMEGKVKITYNRYVVGEGDATLDMGLMSGEHIDG
ncbi:MAG: hypothetical protein RR900_05010, partial [Ruthenibacterium sp.]